MKYPLSIRILHWLMAFMIISLLVIGLYMTGLTRDNPLHGTLYGLHKSLGVCVFLLCLVRIFFRIRSTIPPLPNEIPKFERFMGHAAHYVLYALMLSIPLSGYLMSNSFGFAVNFFGISLPKIIGADFDMAHFFVTAHWVLAYSLIAVIFLHASGVAKHYVMERINLLSRMF